MLGVVLSLGKVLTASVAIKLLGRAVRLRKKHKENGDFEKPTTFKHVYKEIIQNKIIPSENKILLLENKKD